MFWLDYSLSLGCTQKTAVPPHIIRWLGDIAAKNLSHFMPLGNWQRICSTKSALQASRPIVALVSCGCMVQRENLLRNNSCLQQFGLRNQLRIPEWEPQRLSLKSVISISKMLLWQWARARAHTATPWSRLEWERNAEYFLLFLMSKFTLFPPFQFGGILHTAADIITRLRLWGINTRQAALFF